MKNIGNNIIINDTKLTKTRKCGKKYGKPLGRRIRIWKCLTCKSKEYFHNKITVCKHRQKGCKLEYKWVKAVKY